MCVTAHMRVAALLNENHQPASILQAVADALRAAGYHQAANEIQVVAHAPAVTKVDIYDTPYFTGALTDKMWRDDKSAAARKKSEIAFDL